MQLRREPGIVEIVLDRPPANALSAPLLQDFGDALDRIAQDPQLPIVLVRSSSPGYFCGGVDVDALHGADREESHRLVRVVRGVFERLTALPNVTVAAIAGHALGGGYELALACDVRIAAEGTYRIGLPEATLGLLPGGGGTQRLTRLIGPGRAALLMTAALVVEPSEAEHLGMVDWLIGAPTFDTELVALCRRMADTSAQARVAIKGLVQTTAEVGLAEGLSKELDELDALLDSDDYRRRLGAYVAARKQ